MYLLLVFVFSLVSAAQESPNVVIFLADDLGYGDLECFGHPTSSTPNINKLAENSKVFTNFYVGSSVCTPSRAALLTGMYPVSTGMWPGVFFPEHVGGLDPAKYTTIAKYLKEQNYATQMIGKWHLGVGRYGKYLPTNHGFDHYLGIPYSHDMCPCPTCFPGNSNTSCNIGCTDLYVGCPTFSNLNIVNQPTDLTTLTHRYTEAAKEFIKGSGADNKPFFLYMAYQQPHHPQFAGP